MTQTARQQVLWDASMLEAETPLSVEAFSRSIHAFAKRLSPERRAEFLFSLDSSVYWMLGEAAIGASKDGLHPKHHILRYHDFFCDRIKPGERAIDLGSGVGALARSIASRTGAHVTGIDWTEKNVSRSRELAALGGIEASSEFHLGDITALRIPGRFDAVILSNVLEHLTDRERLLAQWREWYNPSRFLIRVPALDRDWRVPYKRELGVEWRLDDTHETEYTRDQLARELGTAGLEITELVACWGEYWLVAKPR